jgi:hypothetical protein
MTEYTMNIMLLSGRQIVLKTPERNVDVLRAHALANGGIWNQLLFVPLHAIESFWVLPQEGEPAQPVYHEAGNA